ncbi:MAG: hypothetical protein H6Q35_1351 [Proteobacteria bacterium]|nr:hypothetical protein [Pseudomonadota bacterium]
MEITKKFKLTKLYILLVLVVLVIWSMSWYYFYYANDDFIQNIKDKPLGDFFDTINVLFGGLGLAGVIVTLLHQINETSNVDERNSAVAKALLETAESNKIIANEAREKAILDLYQTFCSEYFQKVKTSSMNVMIAAIQNKNYCDFMISRFFIISNKTLDVEILLQSKKYKELSTANSSISMLEKEQSDRFKLDELINFFTLLSHKNESSAIIKNCDFFYDWWRPLFWFISIQQLEYYNSNELVQKYSQKPYFHDVVKRLDAIYGWESFDSTEEFWNYFLAHPKIQSYGIDPKFKATY